MIKSAFEKAGINMQTELKYIKGHIFADFDGRDWLVDTGAPLSFGETSRITIDGVDFTLPESYAGLDATRLSAFIDHPIQGLVGVDVLNNFDTLFDVPASTLTITAEEIVVDGERIPLEDVMGIPVIEVGIDGESWRMFFDSGARISYFQDESITTFPSTGEVTDFYPGFGQFQTDTYLVDFEIGSSQYSFQCGSLPGLLGMTLSLAGTDGIVGNELIFNRKAGYSPRRKVFYLAG